MYLRGVSLSAESEDVPTAVGGVYFCPETKVPKILPSTEGWLGRGYYLGANCDRRRLRTPTVG